MSEWDDFVKAVENGSVKRAPGCTVGAFLRQASKLTRIQIEAALGRPELTTTAIARAMRDRGVDISDFTVRRHRRGDCSCPKNGQ